jgi:hypothetical protein
MLDEAGVVILRLSLVAEGKDFLALFVWAGAFLFFCGTRFVGLDRFGEQQFFGVRGFWLVGHWSSFRSPG